MNYVVVNLLGILKKLRVVEAALAPCCDGDVVEVARLYRDSCRCWPDEPWPLEDIDGDVDRRIGVRYSCHCPLVSLYLSVLKLVQVEKLLYNGISGRRQDRLRIVVARAELEEPLIDVPHQAH